MGDKRVKVKYAIAAAAAIAVGVLAASVAGAGAQGPGDYTSSTTSTTPSTTSTTTLPSNKPKTIHYSLRFAYTGKHRHATIVGRVYCHSSGCKLKGGGQLQILPYQNKHGQAAQTFRLGNASGTFPRRTGRKVAGRIKLRVSPNAAKAVQRAIRAGARGKVRAKIIITATNTANPNVTKKRVRSIKLFAHSRHGGHR